MKKKKIFVIILCLVFSYSFIHATGEGFLPSLEKTLGIDCPLIGRCISHTADQSKVMDDGRTREEYQNVSISEYEKIGKCYFSSGFILDSQKYEHDSIVLSLKKEGQTVEIEYNTKNNILIVLYPKYYSEDTNSYNINEESESLFPDIQDIAGPVLPSVSVAIGRAPDSNNQTNDNMIIEQYNEFSEDDYKTASDYFLKHECVLIDYSKDNNVLVINLAKRGTTFTFKYDPIKRAAFVEYSANSLVEPMVTSTPRQTATPRPRESKKAISILEDSYIIELINTCPSIAKVNKSTKDIYSSYDGYRKAFPNQNGINTWKISIQTGVYAFSDELNTTLLTVIPKGQLSEVLPVLSWEIDLLETLPSIIEHAKQYDVKLIVEKRIDGGDYAEFADSNGVIDLLDQKKYEGVLSKMHSLNGMLQVIEAFGQLGDIVDK